MRRAKGKAGEAMYPLIATEKSEQSSLLVSEMEGSKPQGKWEIGSCSKVAINMGLCNCGSVVSALGTGSKGSGWTHVWLFLLLSQNFPFTKEETWPPEGVIYLMGYCQAMAEVGAQPRLSDNWPVLAWLLWGL